MAAGSATGAMTQAPLRARHVVVTRPAGQAGHLCEQLLAAGAQPLRFPVLAVSALADQSALQEAAIALDGYDIVVFVSPNAVQFALPVLLRLRPWPAHLAAAVMGNSSEQTLAKFAIPRVIAPATQFDSESLLALPPMHDVAGRRVLICRGDGGRALLGDTLRARGAQVDYLTCYRRCQAASDPAPLLAHWQAGTLDAVTLTSSEGVDYFADLIGRLGQTWWRHTPTFVTHRRIAEAAARWKLDTVILAEPGDAGLLGALSAHFAHAAPR